MKILRNMSFQMQSNNSECKVKWRPIQNHSNRHKTETNPNRNLNIYQLFSYFVICGVLLIKCVQFADAAYGCLSNPCIFGVCIDDLNSSYSCYCIDGYTGRQCQTNWDECWSNPCLNGGTCIDGVASYNCSCPDGFNGANCEENFDECLSNPCQNGGTCHDRDNGYVCYCPLGYSGAHCELDVAVCDTGSGNKCHNGGHCVEGRGLDFTCDCAPGWKGRFCSINIDECESAPCQNGGICIDKIASYACVCAMGFTGVNCEEEILVCNDSPCKNSALCLMEEGQPVCYCVPDFHGEKCEYQYDECQIGPRCMNGGTCVDGIDDFSCSCKSGYSGMFCECKQLSNGELDCNYTMASTEIPWYTSPRTLTPTIPSTRSRSSTITTLLPTVDYESTSSPTETADESTSSSIFSKPVPTFNITLSTTDSYDTRTSTSSFTESSSFYSSISDSSLPTILSTEFSSDGSTIEHESIGTTVNVVTEDDRSSTQATKEITETSSDLTSTLMSTLRSSVSTKQPPKGRPCIPVEPTTKTTHSSTSVSETHSASTTFSSTKILDPSATTTTVDGLTESTIERRDSTIEIMDSKTSPESSTTVGSTTTKEITEDETIHEATTTSEKPEVTPEIPIITVTTLETPKTSVTETTTKSAEISEMTTKSSPKEQETTTPQTTEADGFSTIKSTTVQSTVNMTTMTSVFATTTQETFTFTTVANTSGSDCSSITCYNGGTCVVTSEGPRCVCRFDRQDPYCKSPIRIKNAAFAGDSYLSHLIYSENHPDFDIQKIDSVLPIKIELKARTRASEGLILLAIAQGSKGGHYTALFLHNGLLQFQFSCGLQTMLLSELEAPINTGHEFTIQVELDFSRNHSHCNASLRVNDTLAMSGDQPTWLGSKNLGKSKTIESIWLHLGGAPQTPIVLMAELPGAQGFTGCLHSLRINDGYKEIFRDANDGFGITECGSLACLANPCKNGAVCEEKIHEQNDLENDIHLSIYEDDVMNSYENRWQCRCPTGYLGPTCEVSVCTNNPCQYGGTCVEFPGSGYICLCPLGKHGHYCEHNLEIDQPSFSGSVEGLSSYISYPIPIPLEATLDLSFRISPSTLSQISLIAFIGQAGSHDEKSDHIALSFIQGYIMLTWNLGSGPRRIFTQKPLEFHDDDDEPTSYLIQVVRQGRKASLYVDGKLNATGNSPGDVTRLDVVPILYIGGHANANFSTLPHDLPLHSGFQGCIYDLQLKSGSLVVPLHETRGIIGRSVGQCNTKECHRHACHNNGACLQHGATYTCICPDGWYGTLCSQKANPCDTDNNKCGAGSVCVPLINGYECDCPLGRMGKSCNVSVKYLSDVSLTGKRSYFALNWPNKTVLNLHSRDRYRQQLRSHDVDVFNYDSSSKLMARNIMEHQRKVQLFSMEFQVRPLSDSGVLVFLGNLNDPNEGFISLSIKGGIVEFRIAGQNGQISIVRSNRILAIGEWHKVKMSQNGRRLTLWIEGSSSSNLLQPNSLYYNNYNSLIYIGGLPDLSKMPYNSVSGYPIPFKGCVRQFYINGQRYVLNEQTIVESRNINDCDGTACGGDSCDMGGHCYLDNDMHPHCKCPPEAKGLHCQIPESCHVISCKNNGICMPNGECSCKIGWAGYFCEIATNKYSVPSFNGKSYMRIPNQRLTLKDKRNGLSQYSNRLGEKLLVISMNFSTIDAEGLLLWNGNNENFLGLGLENGFLKLASNLLDTRYKVIDIPMSGYITDGGWHNVRLEIDVQNSISIFVDQRLVFTELDVRKGTFENFSLDENYFIGGFPFGDSVSNRTLNKFYKSFSGCLQDVQISNGQQVPMQETTAHQKITIQDFSHYDGENIGECELYDEFVNNYY